MESQRGARNQTSGIWLKSIRNLNKNAPNRKNNGPGLGKKHKRASRRWPPTPGLWMQCPARLSKVKSDPHLGTAGQTQTDL